MDYHKGKYFYYHEYYNTCVGFTILIKLIRYIDIVCTSFVIIVIKMQFHHVSINSIDYIFSLQSWFSSTTCVFYENQFRCFKVICSFIGRRDRTRIFFLYNCSYIPTCDLKLETSICSKYINNQNEEFLV